MTTVIQRLIKSYKNGLSFKEIADQLRPDVKNINTTWIKNMTRELRKQGMISIEDRGAGWTQIIKGMREERNIKGSTVESIVPRDLLDSEALQYTPRSYSYTRGVAAGFQRFSGIFRLEYIGQILSFAEKEYRETKEIIDEAMRIWIKARRLAEYQKMTPDQLLDNELEKWKT